MKTPRTVHGSDTAARRVLVLGAAGRIGRVLSAAWQDRYRLVLADVARVEPVPGAEVASADVRDRAAMRALCERVDTVVNLAMTGDIPGSRSAHYPVNVLGAQVAMAAAAEAGCRRFVQASSLAIVLFPARDYSLMKSEVEAHARALSAATGLSIHCLRLGQVMARDDRLLWPGNPELGYALTHDDLARLFTGSVEAPDAVRFGVFNGTSLIRGSPHDLSATTRALGYLPHDDVGALARRHFRSPLGVLRRTKSRLVKTWT